MNKINVKTLVEQVFEKGLRSLRHMSFIEKMTDRSYTVLETVPVSGMFVSSNWITKHYHDNGEQETTEIRYHERDIPLR